jgi:multidrug efflux system membrane fusion protein
MKRWAEINKRIDAGEFGEEIKKLPEDQRRQKMMEPRRQREAGAGGGSASGARQQPQATPTAPSSDKAHA